MNNKKIISIIAVIMAALMLMGLVVSVIPTTAFAVTQSDVDAIQKQKDELTAKRQQSQNKVDELKAQQADVLDQKAALDERNQYALEQIDLVKEQIQIYTDMIAEKEAEVNAAKRVELAQLERYRTRVRAMEENGNYGFLALILNATSLGELLTTVDDIGEIMESDRQLEDEYIAAREEHERIQAEYEQVKEELEGKKAELEQEQAELERQIEEAYQLIAELQEDIDNAVAEWEKLLAAEDDMTAHLNAVAAELARQREEARRAEEERRKAEEAANAGNNNGGSGGGSSGGNSDSGSSTVTGTGSFVWPVPSCYLITSRYGNRVHPVTGVERFHAGVDIGASAGSTIVAADGGTVVIAEYSSSYGNYVMIDHGNGYTTVYAHMSSIAVSAGQSVSQSDTIGYVGSTGVSTGPHCHYEIRYNGGTTDPLGYYSGGFTFWNC